MFVKVKVQGYGGIGSIAHLLKRECVCVCVNEVDNRWDGIYRLDSVYMRALCCCLVGFTFWAIIASTPHPMVQWPLGLFFGKSMGTISTQ